MRYPCSHHQRPCLHKKIYPPPKHTISSPPGTVTHEIKKALRCRPPDGNPKYLSYEDTFVSPNKHLISFQTFSRALGSNKIEDLSKLNKHPEVAEYDSKTSFNL